MSITSEQPPNGPAPKPEQDRSAYIVRPVPDRTDDGLRRVFMEAKLLTFEIGEVARRWPKPPTTDEYYPAATLRMLEMIARVDFAAAVSLEYEDWLAYAADLHLRALLETYAHVAWILGMGGLKVPSTARGRAVCVELGQARALLDEVQATPAGPLRDRALEAFNSMVDALRRFHSKDGCTCHGTGRTRKAVQPTLEAMAKAAEDVRAPGAQWMGDFWRSSSRVSHYGGFERMVKSAGISLVAEPAEPWQRANGLSKLVNVYSSIVRWVLELYSLSDAERLYTRLHELLRDPAIIEARAHAPELPAPSPATP